MNKEEYFCYGWLNVYGDFFEVPWGEHTDFAIAEIASTPAYQREFDEGYYEDEREYLIEKGWVLLHNPTGELAYVSHRNKKLTKSQREFLFDYFYQREEDSIARQYLED